jgi:hypothetical protein
MPFLFLLNDSVSGLIDFACVYLSLLIYIIKRTIHPIGYQVCSRFMCCSIAIVSSSYPNTHLILNAELVSHVTAYEKSFLPSSSLKNNNNSKKKILLCLLLLTTVGRVGELGKLELKEPVAKYFSAFRSRKRVARFLGY